MNDVPVAAISYAMQCEMRAAVKEAERRVLDEWNSAPRSMTVDSPEAKAYREAKAYWSPTKRKSHPLLAAKATARAAARDEVRARWAREKAQQETALPSHIERLSHGETVELDLELGVADPIKVERAAYVAKVIRTLSTGQQRNAEIEKLRVAFGAVPKAKKAAPAPGITPE
jgi:hypothetical protein